MIWINCGHPRTPETTYLEIRRDGVRNNRERCRICMNEASRRNGKLARGIDPDESTKVFIPFLEWSKNRPWRNACA